MTDLELLINEYEHRQAEYRAAAYRDGGEFEDAFSKEALHIISVRLSVLRHLKDTHSEIAKKTKESENLRRQMERMARTMSNRIIYPGKYTGLTAEMLMPTFFIDMYLKKIQEAQDRLLMVEKELKEIQYDGIQTNTPDFIYRLTEAVYDGLLDSYEIKLSGLRRPRNLCISVRRKSSLICIEISHLKDASYPHKYDHEQISNLRSIGYKEIEDKWLYTFDMLEGKFDTLIFALARTLLEVFHAARQELEVTYQEYT